jgi:hypothetical protein
VTSGTEASGFEPDELPEPLAPLLPLPVPLEPAPELLEVVASLDDAGGVWVESSPQAAIAAIPEAAAIAREPKLRSENSFIDDSFGSSSPAKERPGCVMLSPKENWVDLPPSVTKTDATASAFPPIARDHPSQ